MQVSMAGPYMVPKQVLMRFLIRNPHHSHPRPRPGMTCFRTHPQYADPHHSHPSPARGPLVSNHPSVISSLARNLSPTSSATQAFHPQTLRRCKVLAKCPASLFPTQFFRSKSQLPRTAQPSHKAASANPLGFVRAGCFESPAPLSAGDGAS